MSLSLRQKNLEQQKSKRLQPPEVNPEVHENIIQVRCATIDYPHNFKNSRTQFNVFYYHYFAFSF